MTPARRRLVLLVLMALTGAAVQWAASDEQGREALALPAGPGARESAPRAGVAEPPKARATVHLDRFERPGFGTKANDLFASRNWSPAPRPSAAAPVKAPAPAAPPLPFAFFGRMQEEGRTVVFLARGARTFTVAAGDTIDGVYRIEEIGRENVVLTYLPLKQTQTLHIGAIN
jgi:hypothetical protein